MINICSIDATEYLRAKLSMELTTPTAKQVRWVTKTTNQFIKMYENGQWTTLMKTFKSSGHSIVTEASSMNASFSISSDSPREGIINGVKNVFVGDGKNPSKISQLGSGIKDLWNSTHISVKIIGILISAVLIIRGAIYYFFNCAGKLSDRLKNVTTILRANASSENSPTAVEKQKKVLNQLENMTDVIDYKITKSEKAAELDMKKANKEDYNPQEINNISGSDFEF
jgi:hypothetical protein